MRAHLRTLGACTLLVGMSVVSRASADEAPAAAVQPPPATPKPAALRFEDEVAESHVTARLAVATEARTGPTNSGQRVADLPPGAVVTRLASRGDSVLVEFENPEKPHEALAGWVPMTSLVPPPATAGPTATSAATIGPDGRALVEVHIDGPAGVTLEGRTDGEWQEVCQAPCDVRLPLDAKYRTHGEGFRVSRTFALAPVGGRAVLHVAPASSGMGAGGVILGVGVASVGIGGAVVVVGVASDDSRGSHGGWPSGAAVAGVGVVLVGAVVCLVGGVILASRSPTKVRQPMDLATAPVPTWTTGLERAPSVGTSFVMPLLSGSF